MSRHERVRRGLSLWIKHELNLNAPSGHTDTTYSAALGATDAGTCAACPQDSSTYGATGGASPAVCLCVAGFQADGAGGCEPCAADFFEHTLTAQRGCCARETRHRNLITCPSKVLAGVGALTVPTTLLSVIL